MRGRKNPHEARLPDARLPHDQGEPWGSAATAAPAGPTDGQFTSRPIMGAASRCTPTPLLQIYAPLSTARAAASLPFTRASQVFNGDDVGQPARPGSRHDAEGRGRQSAGGRLVPRASPTSKPSPDWGTMRKRTSMGPGLDAGPRRSRSPPTDGSLPTPTSTSRGRPGPRARRRPRVRRGSRRDRRWHRRRTSPPSCDSELGRLGRGRRRHAAQHRRPRGRDARPSR